MKIVHVALLALAGVVALSACTRKATYRKTANVVVYDGKKYPVYDKYELEVETGIQTNQNLQAVLIQGDFVDCNLGTCEQTVAYVLRVPSDRPTFRPAQSSTSAPAGPQVPVVTGE